MINKKLILLIIVVINSFTVFCSETKSDNNITDLNIIKTDPEYPDFNIFPVDEKGNADYGFIRYFERYYEGPGILYLITNIYDYTTLENNKLDRDSVSKLIMYQKRIKSLIAFNILSGSMFITHLPIGLSFLLIEASYWVPDIWGYISINMFILVPAIINIVISSIGLILSIVAITSLFNNFYQIKRIKKNIIKQLNDNIQNIDNKQSAYLKTNLLIIDL